MKLWRVPGPLVRLTILIVAVVAGFIVLRQQFVPESFGDIGHYRADAVQEIADQEIRYAGMQVCAECHDEAEAKSKSYHRGLACEGCHAAANDHANDPGEYRPVIPIGRRTCLRCHAYLSSRPTGFPQVIEQIHNPADPCSTCHDPHDPTPPEVPRACSACHAAIERTKAVSHHSRLDCETCHESRPEHKENPRAFLPKTPMRREFCGKCHAIGAESSRDIPRVDIAQHGGRYLCWQCHYPHFPEGR